MIPGSQRHANTIRAPSVIGLSSTSHILTIVWHSRGVKSGLWNTTVQNRALRLHPVP